jgi:hypothetical protein
MKFLTKISVNLFSLTILVFVAGIILFVPAFAQASEEPAISRFVGWVGRKAGNVFLDAILVVPGYLSILLLKIITLLTWIAGILLNFVVKVTIVEMAQNLRDSSIIEAWRTIRDVANIGFIFILLFAGIQTILGVGSDIQRLIVRVVVVAVLINFSLFFTKIVIDASNVLAMLFYGAMAPGAMQDPVNWGISFTLMDVLKLSSIFNVADNLLDGSKLFTIGVMGSVFALVAAWVFFAIAIMLIIRYVVLIFVLILSPIAFLAWVLPALNPYAKKWSNALTSQAFFAPIFFLLIWIVIKVSQGLFISDGNMAAALIGTTTADGDTDPEAGAKNIGIIFNFIVVIAMLVASLVIAKEWASKAGGSITNITNKAMGYASGSTMGSAAWTGRRTLGQWGVNNADNDELKRRAVAGGFGGATARLQLAAARKASTSTFDARNTATVKKTSELAGVKLGDFNMQKKGGRAQTLKARQDDYKKRYEAYKPDKDTVSKANNEEEVAARALREAEEKALQDSEVQAAQREAELARERSTSAPLANLSEADLALRKARHEQEIKAAENKVKNLVVERTEAERETHKEALERKAEVESRLERLAERKQKWHKRVSEGPWIVRPLGVFMTGKEKAKAIRAIKKDKTKEDKFKEAAKELFAEGEKKAETDKASGPVEGDETKKS